MFLIWNIVACGNIASSGQHEVIHDAAIDTQELPPLREARELVSGGTRMTGATYTFDIQVGHAVQQGKAAGATYQFETNAAVKP
jgi:hypothetical protein